MKLTPARIRRLLPVTRTDSLGNVWLTGYERKPGSRKSGKYMLKEESLLLPALKQPAQETA